MDKELIKKYKQEFEHWLTGGELLFMPEDKQTWFDTLRSEIDWSIKGTYVINDTYVQLRIALTKGKTIQVYGCIEQNISNPSLDIYGWKDFKSFKPHSLFSYDVENYRIKPEEPKFKVGDWVRSEEYGVIQLTPKNVDSYNKYTDTHIKGSGVYAELWQPKAGDWCWFWDSDNFPPKLRQFKRLLISNKHQYESFQTFTYIHCEPFLGKLPTTLKGM